jgi:hypothetical protein
MKKAPTCEANFMNKINMVPLAGIEPALLAELDFESSASTNSATGARTREVPWAAKVGQCERCEGKPQG